MVLLQVCKKLKTEHGTVKRVAEHLGIGTKSQRGRVKKHEIDAGVKPGMTSQTRRGSRS